MVERFLYTEDVGGSSPSSPTTLGSDAILATPVSDFLDSRVAEVDGVHEREHLRCEWSANDLTALQRYAGQIIGRRQAALCIDKHELGRRLGDPAVQRDHISLLSRGGLAPISQYQLDASAMVGPSLGPAEEIRSNGTTVAIGKAPNALGRGPAAIAIPGALAGRFDLKTLVIHWVSRDRSAVRPSNTGRCLATAARLAGHRWGTGQSPGWDVSSVLTRHESEIKKPSALALI